MNDNLKNEQSIIFWMIEKKNEMDCLWTMNKGNEEKRTRPSLLVEDIP